MISNHLKMVVLVYWIGSLTMFFLAGLMGLISPLLTWSWEGLWEMNSLILSFQFNMKSWGFLLFLMMVSISVYWWARYYMSYHWKPTLFYLALTTFVSSMVTLLLSNSFLSIFLGWEGLGLSSFLLIIFYQNFMSAKGGLFTLLTNRVGDAVLLMCLVYWLVAVGISVTLISAILGLGLLLITTTTKSAQWPFTNWLPAAMAAPTPVSALVHSSTLVTAGVWLLIRFNQNNSSVLQICFWLGSLTLSMASLAAFFEADAKKVVALSTLSQLGLMFLSLALGNVILCLFHVLTHALAKANLFMVTGTYLHFSSSQQDSRMLSSGSSDLTLSLGSVISGLSLSGLMFLTGFYSKEQILLNIYNQASSLLAFGLLFMVAVLTAGYCFKLVQLFSVNVLSLMSMSGHSHIVEPINFLSGLSVVVGYSLLANWSVSIPKAMSMEGFFWTVLLIVMVSLLMISNHSYVMFKLQDKLMNEFSPGSVWKTLVMSLDMSMVEGIYLLQVLSITKIHQFNGRSLVVASVVSLLVLGLL